MTFKNIKASLSGKQEERKLRVEERKNSVLKSFSSYCKSPPKTES